MAVDAAALAPALGVTETAGADNCPDVIQDEAIIRTAGHVRNRRGFGVQDGRIKTGAVQMDLAPVGVSAVRQSGAAALLSPWVRRTA